MKRRELMLLLGGAWRRLRLVALRAQQKAMPVVGFLSVRLARTVCTALLPRSARG